LEVRDVAVPTPKPGEVVVRVHGTSLNPIDVKRAEGYGRRLLSLRGA
jgi:NADPH:quinone reductase-like Zn-dependent oxidoreductase